MNELTNGKTMTTKELADYLRTSPKVVIENARKCLPNKIIKNGKVTLWTQKEVTILIEQMKTSNPNQNTFTEAVKAVSTELTPALKIKQAMLLMQEGYEEELAIIKQRAELAEKKCIEQQPKVVLCDALTSAKNAIYMADAIKILETGFGRNIAFRKLRQLHILQENNLPYQEYIDRGYFRVKENVFTINGNNYINKTTMVYQRGMDFLRKFFTENK